VSNSAASTQPRALSRVPSGVPGLDEILGGGFLKSGVYILQGSPGAGKTILANHACFAHAAAGGNVVYVTMLAESHARLMQHMRSFQFFDESLVPARVYYVSGFNALRTGGLEGIVSLLRNEMRAHHAGLLVLDGLVMAATAASSSEELKLFVGQIQSHATLSGCTALLLTSDDAERPASAEQTMVDGILTLKERSCGSARERELEVVKFRGSSTLRGGHAFRIGAEGIVVYPRFESARRSSPGAAIGARGLSTGVEGLDRMFEIGGLPEGGVAVATGYSGSGKTTLALHFLSRCSAAEPGLFYTFYESPEFLLQIADLAGLPCRALHDGGLLHFAWQPFGENLLDELAYSLFDAIRRTGAKRVVIDGLGGFMVAPSYDGRDGSFLAALANELRRSGATSLITSEERDWRGRSFPIGTATMSALADTLVTLGVDEEAGRLRRTITIGKARNTRCDLRVRDSVLTPSGLRIVDPGGDGIPAGKAGA
jgi:circadian clock protein KaiC